MTAVLLESLYGLARNRDRDQCRFANSSRFRAVIFIQFRLLARDARGGLDVRGSATLRLLVRHLIEMLKTLGHHAAIQIALVAWKPL